MIKYSVVLFLLLLNSLSFAQSKQSDHKLSWRDVYDQQTISLGQSIRLANGKVVFEPGETFFVRDSEYLYVGVVYFEIQSKSCTNPDVSAELELITPQSTPSGINGEVGIELNSSCLLKVYVDPRGFDLPSFFLEI